MSAIHSPSPTPLSLVDPAEKDLDSAELARITIDLRNIAREALQATAISKELVAWQKRLVGIASPKGKIVEERINLFHRIIPFLTEEQKRLSDRFDELKFPGVPTLLLPIHRKGSPCEESLKIELFQKAVASLEKEDAIECRFAAQALRSKIKEERVSFTFSYRGKSITCGGLLFKDLFPTSKSDSKPSLLEQALNEIYQCSEGSIQIHITFDEITHSVTDSAKEQLARSFLHKIRQTVVQILEETITLEKAESLHKSISVEDSAAWTNRLAKLVQINVEELLSLRLSTTSK